MSRHRFCRYGTALLSLAALLCAGCAFEAASDLSGEDTPEAVVVTARRPVVIEGESTAAVDEQEDVYQAGDEAVSEELERAMRAERRMRRPELPPVPQSVEQWDLNDAAADALARIGPPAVPRVAQLLKSPDARERAQAARVLAKMGPAAKLAVPDLVAVLNDPTEEVRVHAARALGQIGPAAAEAVPALVEALKAPEPAEADSDGDATARPE